MLNRVCFLCVLLVITLTGSSHAQNEERYSSLSDLASVTWAVDGLRGLYWGMPAQEVQDVLGIRLRLDMEYSSGLQRYICDFRADWMGEPLYLDPLASNGFEFWRGKLCRISLSARREKANDLLHSLFRKYGPARHDDSLNIYSDSGTLRKKPYVRHVPMVYAEMRPEPSDHVYQWMDRKTEIVVRDGYTWHDSIKAEARFVTVDLEGWDYCSSNLPSDDRKRIREKASDYLEWINWWYKRHGKQTGSILSGGSQCAFCNGTSKCEECKGKGIREYEVKEAGPICGHCRGKGRVGSSYGGTVPCPACRGKGREYGGGKSTQRYKCESCDGSGMCVYCEGKAGLKTREKVDCPECGGKGKIWVPEKKVTCPNCNGKGKFRARTGFMWECKPPFGNCNGTGKITQPAHWEKCVRCSGSGKVMSD